MQFLLALIMSISIGATTGYLGSLMVSKRMALMGGALGHLTLPGIALGLIYNFDVSLGALAFLFIGITLIWALEQKTKLPIEALTAIVFSSSVSIAFLFLPQDQTFKALLGDISDLTILAATITTITSGIIFFITRKIYAQLILMSISQDLAQVEKINIKLYKLIYLMCIAIMVALGVRMVGGLLTAALVSIPACTSKNISHNLFQYSYGALLTGALACLSGLLLFKITSIPAGPLIIISSTTLFLISLFFTKKSYQP